MDTRYIIAILATALLFVLTKSELRYQIGNSVVGSRVALPTRDGKTLPGFPAGGSTVAYVFSKELIYA